MIDLDAVSRLMRDVAGDVVLPRWKQLAPGDVEEKEPGDLVTIADREAELRITDGLRAIMPAVPVIGEEAVAANPRLMEDLRALPELWFVDPIDGTQNFVRGEDRFAVMVTYLRGGETTASWIYLPVQDLLAVAERGSGTEINGQRVVMPAPPTDIAEIIPAAHIKRMTEPLKGQIQTRLSRFAGNRPAYCAGYDYIALLDGRRHFLLYNRTLPWDHAPGCLLASEAGGRAARLDGSAYDPLALEETGLLVAPNDNAWARVREALIS
ncbi:inositol monophosphatase family protein [Govanella unica]|uniref:Inositol monophosphatase n=1 Tax=Govanella unica TaxID=2975056 RepID=A0A9X3TXJ2_9PROT|nr:inositol monophosphatase family protein [Govania unica]MDA5193820.1 inositol monophosphatase [Govania unica]